MKIQNEIELQAVDLTKKIKFHGETNADEEAVSNIKALEALLTSVARELRLTQLQCDSNKQLASAREIHKEIDKLFIEFFTEVLPEPEWNLIKALVKHKDDIT